MTSLVERIVARLAQSPCTRGELCAELGVSRPALGRGLIDLLDSGFVEQTAVRGEARRGKPVTVLSLRGNVAYAIGFDVERTGSSAIVWDRAGRVLAEFHHQYVGVDWCKVGADLCARLKVRLGVSGIDSSSVAVLGVGVPFPVRRTVFGVGAQVPVVSEFYRGDVVERLRETFARFWDVPMLFDNTVCLAGLVEAARVGSVRHLFVRVSGGVGGCFVSSDFGGEQVLACELGHVGAGVVPEVGCYCGRRGCVETVASVGALVSRCGVSGFGEVVSRFYDRDPVVVGVVNEAAGALGRAVGEAITLFAPESVSVGGVVPVEIREFVDLVRLEAFGCVMPSMVREVSVEFSSSDSLACARGAVWAACDLLRRCLVVEGL